jgi:hypothetical protein
MATFMLARRIALTLSVASLSLVGVGAEAQGAGGPPKLAARCYAHDLSVSSTYEPFEAQAKKWIATCVSTGREQKLVGGNASLRAVYENVKHLSGRTTRVTTDFGMMSFGGGNWGVQTVTFKTDVKAPAAPAPTPPSKPTPTILRGDEKLPAALDDELKIALVRVRAAIDEDGGRMLPKKQADRLRCELTKLADPRADDRYISWVNACIGGQTNAMSASHCNDRSDLEIKAKVKSVSDLDQKELWFMHYLRPDIVNASRSLFAGQPLASVLYRLKYIDGDMNDAVHGLRLMGERTQGFLAAPHYLQLNDWIAKEQRDSNGIYACK